MTGALVYNVSACIGTENFADGSSNIRFCGGIQEIVCAVSQGSFLFAVCYIQCNDLVGATGFQKLDSRQTNRSHAGYNDGVTDLKSGHADAMQSYADHVKKYRIFHFYIVRNRNDHGVGHILDQQIFGVTAVRHSDACGTWKTMDADVCFSLFAWGAVFFAVRRRSA